MDNTKILTRSEIVAVLAELHRKRRSLNTRANAIIFRLATCCGLRVSEVAGLTLANVKLAGAKPAVYVPRAIAKRHKARTVPAWWDAATLNALKEWKRERESHGAGSSDPFVCGTSAKPLTVRNIQYRFKTAIKVLGSERVEQLSIHCGRHSFCSHALAGGRDLLEVRDAAGHASIATTSVYLHSVNQDDGTVGNLFAFA